jgi:hypothetical protein
MTCEPVALLEQLLDVHVATADASSLHEGCRTVAKLRGMLDTVEAAMVQRIAALHSAGAAPAPNEVIAKASNVSGRDAKRAVARSEAIGAVPELAAALAEGKVSSNHADVLARVAGRLDEGTRQAFLAEGPLLVGAAGRLTPESFERHCKRVADSLGDEGLGEFERQQRQTQLRHWINRETGMYVIHAELDPEIGTAVFAAMDAEIERLFHSDASGAGAGLVAELARSNEHLAAHAFANLVHRGHASSSDGPVSTEVSVLIDHETLVRGLHEHGVCELADGTPIPVETARRLACDAGVLPIVLGGDGVPIDVGRRRRLATRAQRAALRAMHRTCAFDGCDVPHSRCQPHHLHEWDAGGRTDLANLLPLCHRHHHLVHEGRWRLALDQHRTLTIIRPDGTVHATVPLRAEGRAA